MIGAPLGKYQLVISNLTSSGSDVHHCVNWASSMMEVFLGLFWSVISLCQTSCKTVSYAATKSSWMPLRLLVAWGRRGIQSSCQWCHLWKLTMTKKVNCQKVDFELENYNLPVRELTRIILKLSCTGFSEFCVDFLAFYRVIVFCSLFFSLFLFMTKGRTRSCLQLNIS